MSERTLPTTEQIAQRAYELYRARGGDEGHDLEDWLAAEKELTQSPEQSASGAPKTRAAAAGFQSTSSKSGRVAEEAPVEIAKN